MPSQLSYYLKIDKIRGEVTTKPYDGWIKCESFWYGTNKQNIGMPGYGTVNQKIKGVFVKFHDGNATKPIIQAAADGRQFPEATLVARKGNADVLRITMHGILIVSIGTNLSDLNAETITAEIDCKELKILYGTLLVVDSLLRKFRAASKESTGRGK